MKRPVSSRKEHVSRVASLHPFTKSEWEVANRPIFRREIACESFDPAQDCHLTAAELGCLACWDACLAEEVVEHEHVGDQQSSSHVILAYEIQKVLVLEIKRHDVYEHEPLDR